MTLNVSFTMRMVLKSQFIKLKNNSDDLTIFNRQPLSLMSRTRKIKQ